MTPNKDTFLVSCNITADNPTPCAYIDSLKVQSKEACLCSFDKNGNSYCRKAYDDNNSDWSNLAKAKLARTTSINCHTMNRFGCWDQKDSSNTDLFNAVIRTTRAAHLQNAESCIARLFAAGEFIKFSFVLLAAFVINLL